jgi:2',3'-cyclic-nucleotide 2'-phosphodiesterase (5'-nucleotidase family)
MKKTAVYKMSYFKILTCTTLIIFLSACSSSKKTTSIPATAKTVFGKKDGKVEFIFLHLNDVYEISAIENGKVGGLARVATVRNALLKENPNTFTIMAGDFLSPSVIGTLKLNGKRLLGKHMVDVLNALGIDMVGLGNHEFDLAFDDLQARIDESKFTWLASNAFWQNGENLEPFSRTNDRENSYFPEYKILEVKDGASGETCNVGIWSVVLDMNKKDYIAYSDIFDRSNALIEDVLRPQSSVIVGITHIMVENDKELAEKNPAINLIMGGHEHTNMVHKVGTTEIYKADANAKTVWVHRCSYDIATKKLEIRAQLVPIDDKIQEDPAVATVVKKWEKIADSVFTVSGFKPKEVVKKLEKPLDARDAVNRLSQTELGNLVAKSMTAAAKKTTDCAFFNSGSMRLDDVLEGEITQLDIIRILPFGGSIVEIDIKGSELRKVLLVGLINRARGGYLQWDKIEYNEADKTFKINGAPLDEARIYHVATSEFLLSGKEQNLEFFNENNPEIISILKPGASDISDLRNDIRKALIEYLKKN